MILTTNILNQKYKMMVKINLFSENIDYIKNLLLQTENDIKTMNNQLSEYTTKIQMNSKSTTTQQPNNKYK